MLAEEIVLVFFVLTADQLVGWTTCKNGISLDFDLSHIWKYTTILFQVWDRAGIRSVTEELYSSTGVNWKALLSVFLGAAPCVPGFINALLVHDESENLVGPFGLICTQEAPACFPWEHRELPTSFWALSSRARRASKRLKPRTLLPKRPFEHGQPHHGRAARFWSRHLCAFW